MYFTLAASFARACSSFGGEACSRLLFVLQPQYDQDGDDHDQCADDQGQDGDDQDQDSDDQDQDGNDQDEVSHQAPIVCPPPAPLDMPVKGVVTKLSSTEVARLVALLSPQCPLLPSLRAFPLQTTLLHLRLI